MHADKRLIPESCDRACRSYAHQERSEKPRPPCHGNGVEFVRSDMRFAGGGVQYRKNAFHLSACRIFRNHAARTGKHVLGARDDRTFYGDTVFHDCGGGFVARCFNAKEEHGSIVLNVTAVRQKRLIYARR